MRRIKIQIRDVSQETYDAVVAEPFKFFHHLKSIGLEVTSGFVNALLVLSSEKPQFDFFVFVDQSDFYKEYHRKLVKNSSDSVICFHYDIPASSWYLYSPPPVVGLKMKTRIK